MIVIDGTKEPRKQGTTGRYIVIIDDTPVGLSDRSFKYFTLMALKRIGNIKGWIHKDDLEPGGYNQARYIYRMKNEIKATIGEACPVFDNNRMGFYRIDVESSKIKINPKTLLNHHDADIRKAVETLLSDPKYIDTSDRAVKNKELFSKQHRKLNLQKVMGITVTCGCGKNIRLINAFKCFFCGLWFCHQCAKKHFSRS